MNRLDQLFMRRCFDLARLGAGRTSPNPMVGAVLVHDGRVIGEGYHQAYGQSHAEVNAVNSVLPADEHLVPYSTLYVSLEPCDIQGNTPPCTRLILEKKIPRVILSYIDHTPGVDGAGISRLREAGVEVTVGVLGQEGKNLSLPRNIFIRKGRPYIILKFAQAKNGVFAPVENRQLWLSNVYSKRLTHKWRSEVDAILVGANTALADNPKLTNRYYFGKSPYRVVLDRDCSLPRPLSIFDGQARTLVFTENIPAGPKGINTSFHALSFDNRMAENLLKSLASQGISTLMVEGGIKTLQHFILAGLWDEARVLVAGQYSGEGRMAPALPASPEKSYSLGSDELLFFRNPLQALNLN
ncbi:MAG: bifunctional diaminohydroxyphosphoribosylaminopyrimidine deaminase/5-amino-6-(5-phosphoribosylamino)uracil reductase RibD [Phaeodactylibacter sp.]|nr:bifunctional diaminohydroxyphosphoribosylaminopyrimidine deaminase/5-amino-6-(5-phosphoribosylamino)uracil reductase RibD [Phaeodactylibacter sp.]MCB9050598.1 bifunctional diaminohydroxyphosphoribosylaminopyrimidine deaminase/5-amino-6-(5-phosphoribosylamino)uracil reductase RibD [Lewinellaceae bacterium]